MTMEEKMRRSLIFLFLILSAPAQATTLGECVAAINSAKAHYDEWQETKFTAEECGAIAAQVTHSISVLHNHRSSKKDIARAIGVLKNEIKSMDMN